MYQSEHGMLVALKQLPRPTIDALKGELIKNFGYTEADINGWELQVRWARGRTTTTALPR